MMSEPPIKQAFVDVYICCFTLVPDHRSSLKASHILYATSCFLRPITITERDMGRPDFISQSSVSLLYSKGGGGHLYV